MSEEHNVAFPLVSIIIRSMDRPTLADALDSVALQTYPNLEVVIVNAKGADHQTIGEWCGHFPIRVVGSDEQLGRSRAANAGLHEARGEYLIFLDDDDWLAVDHIVKLVDTLTTHPVCLAAYTSIACVDVAKQITTQVFEQPFDAVLLMAINFMPIHAVLFSRQLIERGCLMDETLDYYEDWDFWLQASLQGSFVFTPGISGYYRIHDSSGVHQQATFSGEAYTHIYAKWRNLWPAERLAKLMNAYWRMHIARVQMEQELADTQTQLTDTRTQLTDTETQLTDTETQLTNTRIQLIDIQTQLAGCHAELNSIYCSRSWRITAPLRQLNLIIRSFFSHS